jgi:hypothetical protein
MSVQDDTDAVAASLRALIGKVTNPILDELDALRVAVEVRCDSIAAAVSDPKGFDPALQQVIDQFRLAARQRAEAAAHAARLQALEEAEIRWDFERATLEKRHEALQAEAAAASAAARAQRVALEEGLEEARTQADAVRARAEAQLEAARSAQTQLLAETHAQIEAAQAASDRALNAQRVLLEDARAELDAIRIQLEDTRAQLARVQQAHAEARQALDSARVDAERARAVAEKSRAEADERLTEVVEAARAAEQRAIADGRDRAEESQARLDEVVRGRIAASQAAEEAQAQLASVRSEFAARQAADAAARDALMAALDAERANSDAAQAQRSDLDAASAAQAAALAAAHAERDAARGERDAAIGERDRACADRDAACATRDAAQSARRTALEEAQSARAARDAADRELAAARADLSAARAEAETVRQSAGHPGAPTAASMAVPSPQGASLLDRLAGTMRAMDDASSLTHVLDALLDGVGGAFRGAAIFLVRADRLQGWRRSAGGPVASDAPPADVPLSTVSPLTQALTTARVIVSNHESPVDNPPPLGADGWTATLPLIVGHRVVALIQAEDDARNGDAAHPSERRTALTISDLLVRHAGRCLAALTANAALPAVTPEGAQPEAFAGSAPIGAAVATPAPGTPRTAAARRWGGESPTVDDARRYARLLVSEIKRYNEATLGTGARDATLYDRLKDDIERCRRLYAGRVPAELRETSNFFDDALLEILAGGDRDTLRRIEQRLEDGPLGPSAANRAQTTSNR